MVRKLRPIIRNDTEAPELWGSIQQQLPQCMRGSATSASRGSSATIGRKRATGDLLPGPPQKRPALEDGYLVCKDRARFPNICAGPSGSLVALGTVGVKSERRVVARRSTDRGDTWQAPVHLADGINGTPTLAASLHLWRAATLRPRKWSSRVQTMAFPGEASRPHSCRTVAVSGLHASTLARTMGLVAARASGRSTTSTQSTLTITATCGRRRTQFPASALAKRRLLSGWMGCSN